MKPQWVLLPQAEQDLEEIIEYLMIQSANTDLGDRFLEAFFSSVETLSHHQELGSLRKFPFKIPVRRWHIPEFPAYSLYCRIRKELVEVVAIAHGARNITAIMKTRKD